MRMFEGGNPNARPNGKCWMCRVGLVFVVLFLLAVLAFRGFL